MRWSDIGPRWPVNSYQRLCALIDRFREELASAAKDAVLKAVGAVEQ